MGVVLAVVLLVVVGTHHEAGEEPGMDQGRLPQLHPRRHIPGHSEVCVLRRIGSDRIESKSGMGRIESNASHPVHVPASPEHSEVGSKRPHGPNRRGSKKKKG